MIDIKKVFIWKIISQRFYVFFNMSSYQPGKLFSGVLGKPHRGPATGVVLPPYHRKIASSILVRSTFDTDIVISIISDVVRRKSEKSPERVISFWLHLTHTIHHPLHTELVGEGSIVRSPERYTYWRFDFTTGR